MGVNYNRYVSQDVLSVANGAGGASANTLVGYVSSRGLVQAGRSYINYTGSGGTSTVFDTSVAPVGYDNLTATAYNMNTSFVSNLVAWYPLNMGFGSAIYDLAPNRLNGTAVNVNWTRNAANQTTFLGTKFTTSNSALAPWINVTGFDPSSNIQRNGTFTVVAWINYSTSTGSCQGIVGDLTSNTGFQLGGYGACGALNVSGSNIVPWPTSANSFPSGKWEMVTGEYSANNGTATVYLNSTTFASNALPIGLSLSSVSNFTIGTNAWPTGRSVSFNGMMTNVQVYSSFLTATQINNLYLRGATSFPLNNAGLVGWWPLNGNSVDASRSGAKSVVMNSLSLKSTGIVGPSNMTKPAAYFNGQSSYVTASGTPLNIANSITVSIWIDPRVNGAGAEDPLQMNSGCSGYVIWLAENPIQANFGRQCGPLSSGYTKAIQPNTWHNIVGTYNGSAMNIYLDGVLAKSTTGSTTFASSGPLYLGKGTDGYYAGYMGDVQVYNSVLTASQINQAYLSGMSIYSKLNVSIG